MNYRLTILGFDQSIIIAIHKLHAPAMDSLMWWVSQRDSSIILYLLLLFLLMRRFQLSMWKVLLMLAILIAFNDQMASSVFKPLVGRLRPSHDAEVLPYLHLLKDAAGNIYRGGSFGFYSSHAANTMTVAVFLMLIMRPLHRFWSWVLIIWVVLVGYSRMYLGVHYLTDVLMGWAMGALSAFVLWRIMRQDYFRKWHRLDIH